MTIATYETDFYLWTQKQAALLRQGQFSELDTIHLVEEIEDMGNSNRFALESYLSNFIMHLLKWQYQPERRCISWELTIINGRHQIEKRLKNSPSLRPKLPEIIDGEYSFARRNASGQTILPLATFPENCPFTIDEITGDYFPD